MYPHRGGYGNVSKKVFSEKGLGTFCIPEHIFFFENERQVHLKQHP
jgi:hypothetical protein